MNEQLAFKLDKQINEFENNLLKVCFEERNLEMLDHQLKKCCYLIKQGALSTSSSANTLNTLPQLLEQMDFADRANRHVEHQYFRDAPLPAQPPQTFIAENLTTDSKEIEVITKDHFNDDIEPLIVKLEEDSRFAHLYSIRSGSWEKKEITSPYRVPAYHRLLTTKDG